MLLLALAGAGCGNWSNEDIAFVEALPTSQALKVALPAPAGQALCGPPGPSELWGWAKPTGDAFNGAVDFLLGFVDLVKGYEPTTRNQDRRVWGPFADSKHPGNEIRVVMTRAWENGRPVYTYTFEARPGGEFQPVIEGHFTGGSARTGKGDLTIHFGTLRDLGMNETDSDPQGDMVIGYDRTADPRTVSLDLSHEPQGGFELTGFDYGYAGYSSGKGLFHYQLQFAAGYYVVDAWFDDTGAGKAFVEAHLDALPNQTFAFDECWDAASCITFVHDPDGVSQLCPGGVCPAGECPVGLPVGQ